MQALAQLREDDLPTQKYVIKRDGSQQAVDPVKIRQRLENKSDGLNMEFLNFDVVEQKVLSGIFNGNPTFHPYMFFRHHHRRVR